ncbi:MAG TPA: EAL domain-containing protein [Baekduia sp.]|nr:EAL domain-containing protein [Baekduia sp.]
MRAALSRASDAMALVGDDGTVLALSEPARRLLVRLDDRPHAEVLRGLLGAPTAGPLDALPSRQERSVLARDGSVMALEVTVVAGVAPAASLLLLRDVTDRRVAARAIRAAESRYRQILTHAHQGICAFDAAERVTVANVALARIVGVRPEELAGRLVWELTTDPDSARERFANRRAGVVTSHELDLVRADGALIPCMTTVAPELLESGEYAGGLLLTGNLSAARAAAQATFLADHDPLTGVRNRTSLEGRIRGRLRPAGGAVVALGLDRFSVVNQLHRHEGGDRVLRAVARELRAVADDGADVGRVGGDVFAILAPAVDRDGARTVAERALVRLRGVGGGLPLSASAGIAMAGEGDDDGGQLLAAATTALHDAKEHGGGRIAFAGENGWRAALDRLGSAFAEQRFALAAEPVLDLRRDRPARVELRAGLVDDGGRHLAGATLLEVAERAGVVADVDRWVIVEAVRMAAAGRPVSVSLSAATVDDELTPALVERELAHTAADAALLTFGLPETLAVRHGTRARELATRLSALGCATAIDGFGGHLASVLDLERLGVQRVHLARELGARLTDPAGARDLVAALIATAHRHGIAATVAGVQDADALVIARELGADEAHGPHVAPPEPVGDLHVLNRTFELPCDERALEVATWALGLADRHLPPRRRAAIGLAVSQLVGQAVAGAPARLVLGLRATERLLRVELAVSPPDPEAFDDEAGDARPAGATRGRWTARPSGDGAWLEVELMSDDDGDAP